MFIYFASSEFGNWDLWVSRLFSVASACSWHLTFFTPIVSVYCHKKKVLIIPCPFWAGQILIFRVFNFCFPHSMFDFTLSFSLICILHATYNGEIMLCHTKTIFQQRVSNLKLWTLYFISSEPNMLVDRPFQAYKNEVPISKDP